MLNEKKQCTNSEHLTSINVIVLIVGAPKQLPVFVDTASFNEQSTQQSFESFR
jgi:hypothetical protein